MTEPVTKKKTSSPLIPDWSLLPEELLHLVSTHLEDCFDVVHARSVCSTWQSSFPFPSVLLRPSYSLPSFAEFPDVSKGLCTLQKIPLFLFRAKVPSLPANVLTSPYFWDTMSTNDVLTSDYFLGGIGRDESEDHMVLPSPIQCSVKLNIPKTDPTLLNMHDCQVLPLGHQYRMIGWDRNSLDTNYSGVAFIALNMEEGEFVVLLNYYNVLLVLRSAEKRWVQVKLRGAWCKDLVAFRGKFYASFRNGDISVYDPYTLIETPLMHSQPLNLRESSILVRAGDDDELFLVEYFNPYPQTRILDFTRFACRVSILDEKAGKWVVVGDLGDRVLFIGNYNNVSCSAKELPDGCGVSGNSIVFTDKSCQTYAYKYGVDKGDEEDDLTFWRLSRKNRVNCVRTSQVMTVRENHKVVLSTSPVLILRVEHEPESLTLKT